MELPIAKDPRVLGKLYQKFDYLQDLPFELKGCWLDEAVYLGLLESSDFLGFLMGYEVEQERPSHDHFEFLNREDNIQIQYYRHIRPVQPWPQPVIGVAFDSPNTGTVTGTHKVDVVLKDIGKVQVWFGGKIGVIWEAFLEQRLQQGESYGILMAQIWNQIEEYLANQGVERVYTYDRDPAVEPVWYRAFLCQRGYQPRSGSIALVKPL